VVNPRCDEIETPAQVCELVRAAMKYVPAERLFLNPDCGFGTFAARPMNTPEIAARKLAAMVEAARTLREASVAT
jgi:5-methyltetrahydropteroyltriglutamate--homocysteine methyltransferase